MYAGGHGYFTRALPRFGQKASYFAFQNRDWLLVALDSAYKENDLYGEQVSWLENLISLAGERKLILFSHHQPYSLFERQGLKLVKKLSRLLASKRIFAWYWGHEHRCVLFDRHPSWGLHGRCVGHGGFPYFRKQPERPLESAVWKRIPPQNLVPGGLLLDGQNVYIPGHESEYGPNGYMILEFSGKDLFESVHDADGAVLWANLLLEAR